jgi:uncharacterized protein
MSVKGAYTPAYRIVASGTGWQMDITKKIADRLIEAAITDVAGVDADQFTMTLDDRDNAIDWPERGAKLTIDLGYLETGLVNMGSYIVDEVEYQEPPMTITVRGKAADYANGVLKTQKTRTWSKDIAIGSIVKKIAAEHGLKPLVSADLAKIKLPITHQTEESDLNLLTRLAKDYDAIAKPAGGYLLFVLRGESRDANGNPLQQIVIDRDGKSELRVTDADRHKYKSVVAYYHDTASGKRQPVRSGTGEPTFSMKFSYPTKAQAKAAADAKLKALERQTRVLTVSMPGDPRVIAESPLRVRGFREGVNGAWVATKTVHRFSNSGYKTSIEDAEQALT